MLLLIIEIPAIGCLGLALRALIVSAAQRDLSRSLLDAAAAALCWTVSAVGGSARTNLTYLLAESVSVQLDGQILGLIAQCGDLETLESPEFTDRVGILRSGGDLIGHYSLSVLDAVATVLRLAFVLVLLATVRAELLLLALILAPVLWLQRRERQQVIRSMVDTVEQTRLADHLFRLHTDPAAAMEMRIADSVKTLIDLADGIWRNVVRRKDRALWRSVIFDVASWSIFIVCYGSALISVVRSGSVGQAMAGNMLLVITLIANLRKQAEDTVHQLHRTAEGAHFLDAYLALRNDAALQLAASSRPIPSSLTDGIAFHGVSFSYPRGAAPVLSDLSIRLPAGSTVAIVGEHGAGKTTLIKLLCGLYTPSSGHITVDGLRLDEVGHKQWQGRITASFQDFAKFAWQVRESAGCGDLTRLADDARITEALNAGDALGFVAKLPLGLDTPLDASRDGVELSGGQWQRIALSRAFMRTSPLLFVLDEPTASLDAHSEYVVYRRQMVHARNLAEKNGAITVVISHRFSTVRMADLILVLANGAVSEAGSHAELMALNGVYAQLYELQAQGYGQDHPAAPPEGAGRSSLV
ncbi:hypothetical protein Athai_13800 [Actinocatenispora thailandica]|uniref:ABC transporter domain-containing protein n=1 Tax=Actinocatenispora thailandica TaxID=227318 RepID=A0A7R7HV78_9ACTN|nr:hypothetical protein Athai_13800 [Actinocatenispora thailandica]